MYFFVMRNVGGCFAPPCTFYRVSGLRTKELRNILPEMVAFPRHHDVRFAQHLLQLVLAAIKNIAGCRHHWQNSQMRLPECMTKRIKPSVQDFLEQWFLNFFVCFTLLTKMIIRFTPNI